MLASKKVNWSFKLSLVTPLFPDVFQRKGEGFRYEIWDGGKKPR